MLGQYLITLRETLEAALITAIILSYLNRINKPSLKRYIWYGIFLAIIISFSLGVGVWFTYGTLSKTSRLLFESLAAFIAVAVLLSMIYWMATKGRGIREKTEKRVQHIASSPSAIIGLISLEFLVVFREGFETILFITPFLLNDMIMTVIGMFLGFLTAILLAYGIFVVGMKINLQRFFYFTSILLIMLAGGLAGYGMHELLEYWRENGFEAGWLNEPAYDMNIPADNPFHHKGIIGSIFAVMFGYTVRAEWARIIVHLTLLAIAFPFVILAYKKQTKE